MALGRWPASRAAALARRAAGPEGPPPSQARSRAPPAGRWAASACAAAGDDKPWRLSASVVICAPYHSVPDCELSDAVAKDSRFDYRVCCVKRAARSSFMPDAMVFPGGAVEAEDVRSAAHLLGSDALESTVRCAAVREVFEESGVGLFAPLPADIGAEAHATWRGRVRKDAAQLRDYCAAQRTTPAAASLQYWCSFITPDMEHARLRKGGFDTRFYVSCVEAGAARHAMSDAQETVQLMWLTPSEALAAVHVGAITMVPPQWYIFKELCDSCPRLSSVSGHAAGASRALQRDYPIKPYLVALSAEEKAGMLARNGREGETADAVFSLCYPGDEAHPVYPGPAAARHRMLMIGTFGGRMRFELQRDATPQLPLREAKQGWYTLAKL